MRSNFSSVNIILWLWAKHIARNTEDSELGQLDVYRALWGTDQIAICSHYVKPKQLCIMYKHKWTVWMFEATITDQEIIQC